MNYLELLNNSYSQAQEVLPCPPDSKLEYLGEHIFNFTTYESEIIQAMALRALQVCLAISDRQTFEYIKGKDGELWYLLMVNMPFFQGKLEWGGSIRGAWWNLRGDEVFKIESTGIFFKDYEQVLELEFNQDQWDDFIGAMAHFVSN